MDRKLVIIYGSPRTGTTHLFRTLIRHPECFGADYRKTGDGLGEGDDKELSCNEPYNIPYYDRPINTEAIDFRWDNLWEEGKKYMILKAPGYCFAWDYFSQLPNYEVKYIYTERNSLEVINSMVDMVVMNQLADGPDAHTMGCPPYLLEKYEALWKKTAVENDEVRKINRFLLCYKWHIEAVPDEMFEASLKLKPYGGRTNYTRTAKRICDYLKIRNVRGKWRDYLETFHHQKLKDSRKKYLRSLIIK